MAALSTSTVTTAGLTDTLAAVAASDTFTNNGSQWIEVSNASGSSINVTVSAGSYKTEDIADRGWRWGTGRARRLGRSRWTFLGPR